MSNIKTKSFSVDFGGKLNPTKIVNAIKRNGSITTQFIRLDLFPTDRPDDVDFIFQSPLSGPESTAFDDIIAGCVYTDPPEIDRYLNYRTVDPTVNDDILEGYLIGTQWINSVNSKIFVLKSNIIGAANWTELTAGENVFGSQYQEAVSLPASSTTSNTPQDKVVINQTGTPSGTYRISWTYNWTMSSNSANSTCTVIVTLDGDTANPLFLSDIQIKNPGAYDSTGGYTDIAISSGNHVIALKYSRSGATTTVTVSNAKLSVFRIN